MKDTINVGDVFGFLTIIELYGRDKTSHKIWKCQCECGKQINVNDKQLRIGKTKSCGCKTGKLISEKVRFNLRNLKFGLLTVLDFDKVSNKRLVYWKCKCDCGNIVSVRGTNLKNGNTQSCGCTRKTKFGKKSNFDEATKKHA